MIRKNDYFKLGSFIILGSCMLIAVVIILGAGRFFETTYTVETYFDESVNGLAIGSPVKLRGVDVGRLSKVNFVSNLYDDAGESRYVYAECEIKPQLFDDIEKEQFINTIHQDVERGLRVRPTSLGLTGQLFLNFVYVDPADNPPLQINWRPENAYIPSAPSTMSRIEKAISTISTTLESVKKEDLQSIISDVKSIVNTIDEIMKTEGGKEAGARIISILGETRKILKRTNDILADPALDRFIPETVGAVTGINKIVTESADDIIAAGREARQALASFKVASDVLAKNLADPRMQKAMGELAPTLENVSQASKDMTAAVAKVHALVNRLNAVVASEESTVHAILEDTREVMENIKDLSGDAKRYPSGVLFGKPPSKSAPEAK